MERGSLVLNGIITEEMVNENNEPEQPNYFLQPGWDDAETDAHLDDGSQL